MVTSPCFHGMSLRQLRQVVEKRLLSRSRAPEIGHFFGGPVLERWKDANLMIITFKVYMFNRLWLVIYGIIYGSESYDYHMWRISGW